MNLNDLDDAKKFQEHFVTPLVDAVRNEVRPLVESDQKQSDRIAKLESNQKKALVGFAVYATALSTAIGVGLDWARRKLGFVLILSLLLTGCSATKRIAKGVSKVQGAAQAIRGDVTEAKQALKNNDPVTVEKELDSIDNHAVEIQEVTVVVQEHLTQVEDRTPWWGSFLRWGAIAASIGGVIFLLWRFNFFLIAEKVIQRIVDLVAKWIGA